MKRLPMEGFPQPDNSQGLPFCSAAKFLIST
jgi:hypothetical protein